MQILFDQGTPLPLRQALAGHQVATAYEQGWSTLTNGELLLAAESAGFSLLVTTDTNLKYQQDLRTRRIAIVVLGTTSWPRIRNVLPEVVRAIEGAQSATYVEIAIP